MVRKKTLFEIINETKKTFAPQLFSIFFPFFPDVVWVFEETNDSQVPKLFAPLRGLGMVLDDSGGFGTA